MTYNQHDRIIPMDDAIRDFASHLSSHPRTILSARFGDGKSFFLTAVEKKLKRRYVFLKLYPVNYQVVENQDIFEYIKRDLLFQLYGHEMVEESYEIPDSIASYYFLLNNWEDFAGEILKGLSYFDASNTIQATLGAVKFMRSMKNKYDEFKKNGGELGVKLDRFIASFDNKGVYESDPITTILCGIIKDWKKAHPRKKVCLVFEDMDRIDPAHIFRILNVISAQMDYGYKYGISPKSSLLVGNKFGVDNIIVCLDYDNLKNIFHHFYGQKACFQGYINKFSDRGIFQYSLQEQVQQCYMKELSIVSGMSGESIKAIMDQFDFSVYTLRQLYHAIEDVGKQIRLPKTNSRMVPHRGLYIMAAIFRRLGLSSEEVVSILSKAFLAEPQHIGAYVGTSIMIRKNKVNGVLEFTLGKHEKECLIMYSIDDVRNDGLAIIKQQLYLNWNSKDEIVIPEEEMKYILSFVNK